MLPLRVENFSSLLNLKYSIAFNLHVTYFWAPLSKQKPLNFFIGFAKLDMFVLLKSNIFISAATLLIFDQ